MGGGGGHRGGEPPTKLPVRRTRRSIHETNTASGRRGQEVTVCLLGNRFTAVCVGPCILENDVENGTRKRCNGYLRDE